MAHSMRQSSAASRLALLAAALLVLFTISARTQDAGVLSTPVKVPGGLVSGVAGRHQGVAVFKGIPFAAPPVGSLRWRAPLPVATTWPGVRTAAAFSPSCIQTIVEEKKPWTYEFMAHGEVSEDCLYLNVWTPARAVSERRPVLLWIYGGGNVEGSASVPVYDGEGLASKGLVVVTFNYRVGVLGFFNHPELATEAPYHASGNYGLLDQIAAVKWVHDHIAGFGGDPTRITIAGQSAGGQGVHHLTASPLAKGLFARAIIESSPNMPANVRTMAEQEADGVRFAQAKGAASMAELRARPWQEIVAPVTAPAASGGRGGGAGFRFPVVVDGYALTASVRETFEQGRQNDVATISGITKDEGGAVPQPTTTAKQLESTARQRYGNAADEFLQLYPAANDAEAGIAQNASARDQARVSLRAWALARAKTAKTPTYTYFWTHPLPGPDSARYGAFHTSEVPYALNTLSMSGRPFSAMDHRIADTLSSYWVNFATTGDPNSKDLPRWPSVDRTRAVTMEVGSEFRTIPVVDSAAKLGFFEKISALQIR